MVLQQRLAEPFPADQLPEIPGSVGHDDSSFFRLWVMIYIALTDGSTGRKVSPGKRKTRAGFSGKLGSARA
jgi:hypothetical protein